MQPGAVSSLSRIAKIRAPALRISRIHQFTAAITSFNALPKAPARLVGTDLTQWLSDAANHCGFSEAYLPGDSNLDGIVDTADLNNLTLSWHQDVASWSAGDFSADGNVGTADLNKLALNWRQSIPLAASPVPEPSHIFLTILGLALV